MHDLYFFIGLFITIVLAFSYCLVIWKKQSWKHYKEQIEYGFKHAKKIQKELAKPLLKMTTDMRRVNNKKYMERSLKIKLDTENKLFEVNKKMIDKLIETGLTEQEAKELIRNNIKK